MDCHHVGPVHFLRACPCPRERLEMNDSHRKDSLPIHHGRIAMDWSIDTSSFTRLCTMYGADDGEPWHFLMPYLRSLSMITSTGSLRSATWPPAPPLAGASPPALDGSSDISLLLYLSY